MLILTASQWAPLTRAHEERADALTAGYRVRKAAGDKHAIEDFLYTYYATRPNQLRRWHPGFGVGLEGLAPHAAWRWYADRDGVISLDRDAYLRDRGDTVRFVHSLLSATASRPAFTGCFGLHEWAMVYQADERRHPLPLRLGRAGTDAVVESHPIRCTHFDAFRFFTDAAAGLNRVQPTRQSQVDLEQPGCLHASMDCHKWAMKLGPAVPGELALDCFALAADVRRLDMQASPYDLSAYGERPVTIETSDGKAEYVSRQRELASRASVLRRRQVETCENVI